MDDQFAAGANAATADLILGNQPWALDPGFQLLPVDFRLGYLRVCSLQV